MRLPRFRLKLWMLMAATAAIAVGLYVRVYYIGFRAEVVDGWGYPFDFVLVDADSGAALQDGSLTCTARQVAWSGGALAEDSVLSVVLFQYVRPASNCFTEYYYADLDNPDIGVSTECDLEFEANGYEPLRTTLGKLAGERIPFSKDSRGAAWGPSGLAPARVTYRVNIHRATRRIDGPPHG